MAMTPEQYTGMLQSLLPPGTAWPRDPDAILTALLRGFADEFARADMRFDDLLNEFIPGNAFELLADWERVLGLPDSCTANINLSIDQRRAAVGAKLAAIGGQSRQFFIDLAASLGYPGATIDEFRQMTCNDTCNDALNSLDDHYVWKINLPSSGGVFTANCNSDCNSALATWGNTLLECMISKRKAADTDVIFAYI
jgi:uncharacterized protein YmfQ (DUF2313 family)